MIGQISSALFAIERQRGAIANREELAVKHRITSGCRPVSAMRASPYVSFFDSYVYAFIERYSDRSLDAAIAHGTPEAMRTHPSC